MRRHDFFEKPYLQKIILGLLYRIFPGSYLGSRFDFFQLRLYRGGRGDGGAWGGRGARRGRGEAEGGLGWGRRGEAGDAGDGEGWKIPGLLPRKVSRNPVC